MEIIKNRLNDIREEEDELQNKIQEVDIEIKCILDQTEKINLINRELLSKELLLKRKLESQSKRLNNALVNVNNKNNSTTNSSRKLQSLTDTNSEQCDKIIEFETKLAKLKIDSRDMQILVDETLLHLQHIELAKENADKRTMEIEKRSEELKKQRINVDNALENIQLNNTQYLSMEELEIKEKEMKDKLKHLSDKYENSERSITIIERQIQVRTNELTKQLLANEDLKKEMNTLLKEISEI